MSAIDNKHLINIVSINTDTGVKNGKEWSMPKAQCVVTGPDGKTQIGELLLPKALADTPPGKYLAEVAMSVNYQRQVVPVVTALHAYQIEKTLTPKEASAVK